jgi:hypothetical protein
MSKYDTVDFLINVALGVALIGGGCIAIVVAVAALGEAATRATSE